MPLILANCLSARMPCLAREAALPGASREGPNKSIPSAGHERPEAVGFGREEKPRFRFAP